MISILFGTSTETLIKIGFSKDLINQNYVRCSHTTYPAITNSLQNICNTLAISIAEVTSKQ